MIAGPWFSCWSNMGGRNPIKCACFSGRRFSECGWIIWRIAPTQHIRTLHCCPITAMRTMERHNSGRAAFHGTKNDHVRLCPTKIIEIRKVKISFLLDIDFRTCVCMRLWRHPLACRNAWRQTFTAFNSALMIQNTKYTQEIWCWDRNPCLLSKSLTIIKLNGCSI